MTTRLDLDPEQLALNISADAALDRFSESLRLQLREFIAKLKANLTDVTRAELRQACLDEVLPVAMSAPTRTLRIDMKERCYEVVREELKRAYLQ